MSNPFQDAIYEKVVKPALQKISHDADGVVTNVDYYNQLADIQWTDGASGGQEYARGVEIPKDADGIYRQSLKVGDRIRVAFMQGDFAQPYISMVYKKDASRADYLMKNGVSIPRGISF